METEFEVIVIGGGPAGLSAAMILGRCRRTVLVCDHNQPRNGSSTGVHAFLSREGIPPRELRKIVRDELKTYETVSFLDMEAIDVVRLEKGFVVTLEDDRRIHSRKLLLASGLRDRLPPVQGIETFYGKTVHHCPICDGWEHRDQALVAYGEGESAIQLALELRLWSDHITLCSNGPSGLNLQQLATLEKNHIPVIEHPVTRAVGSGAKLTHLELAGGGRVDCDGLFFTSRQEQSSELSRKLGCKVNGLDEVVCGDDYQVPGFSGLYAAGNCALGAQLSIIAAAEGARAAQKIVNALATEYFG